MGLPSYKGLLQHFIKYVQFDTLQCLIMSYWHKYCYIYLIYRMENILARDHIIVLLFWSPSTVKECIQAFPNTRNLRQCFLDWKITVLLIIYLKQLWIWLHIIFFMYHICSLFIWSEYEAEHLISNTIFSTFWIWKISDLICLLEHIKNNVLVFMYIINYDRKASKSVISIKLILKHILPIILGDKSTVFKMNLYIK